MVGGRAGKIWSYLYEIIAALLMGDRIEELSAEINELITELQEMPEFTPARRIEWNYIKDSIPTEVLSGKEKDLLQYIVKYVDGKINNEQFVEMLKAIL